MQAIRMPLSFRLMLTVEMLRDFTSVQSDFDIRNTAISNNPFSPWTLYPFPLKISSDLRELHKWPLAFRGEQLLHLLHTSYATGFEFDIVS